MFDIKLSKAPLSARLFLTMVIVSLGLTYMILAAHIFIDTAFKISLIKDAYSAMDWTELVDHSHRYLPYYAIYMFALPIIILIFGTSYPEWLKRLAAVIPVCLIILDIGSMWGIRFIHAGIFSWGLFLAGNFLALSFGAIAGLILYDIWLRK